MTEDTGTSAPRVKDAHFHCESGHNITEQWTFPMTASAFSRHLKAMICPACESKKIFMGHAKAEADG